MAATRGIPTEQQRIGRTDVDSEPRWPAPAPLPSGPNIIVVMLDDVGFGQFSCYGSSIQTPAIDDLAARGLRYTNFHTTAVCSPTRAALLTGRNPHTVGFGHIVERIAGFSGYSTQLPDSAATIAEVLRGAGYATRAFGKWHLAPPHEVGPHGPYDRWPLGRGFDRFYGFLGGSTDQYAPALVQDNTPIEPPDRDDYHLSADLVDRCIADTADLIATGPHRPFFAYLAFGAGHAPHHVPQEWADRYRGVFDDGWDVERERILARQIELGIMPSGTELGLPNPGVPAWSSLTDDQRRVAVRMMEVYAGFLSHTDAQLGRLVQHLEDAGVLDDTVIMVMSDNGASAEGGPEGSVDEGLFINNLPQTGADALAWLDELGGPALYNHYPWGWAQAGNTPFRWYKQFTHAGGITNGLVLSWPGGPLPQGEVRDHYHHVVDIMPTLLDIAAVPPPETVRGVTQLPLHGVSMRYSFTDAKAESRRHSQHYEMWGNRGMYADGWMAVCRLHPDAPGALPPAERETAFDDLAWELYDHTTDPTECHDLAAEEPARLRELVDRWWACAGRYDVLPVDTRPRWKHWPVDPPQPVGADPEATRFVRPGGPYERGSIAVITSGSFTLHADVTVADAADGVLFALGGRHGGYFWYLRRGRPFLEIALSSIHTTVIPLGEDALPAGRYELGVAVDAAADLSATIAVGRDGRWAYAGRVPQLLKRSPIGSARGYVGYLPSQTPGGQLVPPALLTGRLHRLMVRPGVRAAGSRDEAEALAAALREQ